MARMKRARRAAKSDPRYASQKHTAAVHQRRLASKIAHEGAMKQRAARKKVKASQ